MNNYAVIPARGGSKRIPRKNVKAFAGRPMISYAIEAAHTSGLFQDIIVSTDDDEIAQVARDWGAQVPFSRPAELSDDQTVTVPVIAHATSWLIDSGRHPEAVCCIYPCVPLLRAEDLVGGYELFASSGSPYVYPVVAFHSSPWRAMLRSSDGPMRFMHPEHELTRTQDLPVCYFDAGQFYWGRPEAWTSGLRMHSNGRGYVVPGHRIVDIDTPEDWARAELIARAL